MSVHGANVIVCVPISLGVFFSSVCIESIAYGRCIDVYVFGSLLLTPNLTWTVRCSCCVLVLAFVRAIRNAYTTSIDLSFAPIGNIGRWPILAVPFFDCDDDFISVYCARAHTFSTFLSHYHHYCCLVPVRLTSIRSHSLVLWATKHVMYAYTHTHTPFLYCYCNYTV